MRAIDYYDVLNGTARLCGVRDGQVSTELFYTLRPFHSSRLQTAWERAAWPELIRTERRQFRQNYDASTAYAATAEVFYPDTGAYYQALKSTTGNAPADANGDTQDAYWADAAASYSADDYSASTTYTVGQQVYYPATDRFYQLHTSAAAGTAPTDTTKWGVLTAFVRSIAQDQSWETTEIGDVLEVYAGDPRTNRSAATLDYETGNDLFYVFGSTARPWVRYRLKVPVLIGDPYSSTATYAVGNQVYFTLTGTDRGNFYDCITATTAGESPASAAAKWVKVEIPLMFKRYLEHGAYADFLAQEEQNEKRPYENAKADRLLDDQLLRVEGTTQQRRRVTVHTR